MSGPRRHIITNQSKRAAQERSSPKWTLIDPGSTTKYKFIVTVGHPNLQTTTVELSIDNYTLLDDVATYLENFVNEMLPSNKFTIYAMVGYPKGVVVPLEELKVIVSPHIGWPRLMNILRSPVTVTGELIKETEFPNLNLVKKSRKIT